MATQTGESRETLTVAVLFSAAMGRVRPLIDALDAEPRADVTDRARVVAKAAERERAALVDLETIITKNELFVHEAQLGAIAALAWHLADAGGRAEDHADLVNDLVVLSAARLLPTDSAEQPEGRSAEIADASRTPSGPVVTAQQVVDLLDLALIVLKHGDGDPEGSKAAAMFAWHVASVAEMPSEVGHCIAAAEIYPDDDGRAVLLQVARDNAAAFKVRSGSGGDDA